MYMLFQSKDLMENTFIVSSEVEYLRRSRVYLDPIVVTQNLRNTTRTHMFVNSIMKGGLLHIGAPAQSQLNSTCSNEIEKLHAVFK